MPCQDQGVVPWDYNQLRKNVAPKEHFCRDYNWLGKVVVPKEHFLDSDWSVCVT